VEHSDGWGIGWIDDRGCVDVCKEPTQASRSADFASAIADTCTDMALLHLRQASQGMPLTLANTHPFLAHPVAFAHNGYAWPAEILDTLVAEADGPSPMGDTDSERYCSLVRARFDEVGAPAALRVAAQRITERARMTSLNALLLTPESLLAVAWWHAPTIRAQPDGETERDYRLWYLAGPDRVVVASAGIHWTQERTTPDAGWQELPDRSVLEVRRGTLEVIVHAAV